MASLENEDNKLERYFVKPALVGGITYVGLSSKMLNPLIGSKWSGNLSFQSGSVLSTVMGGKTSLAVPAVVGVSIGLGSLLAEVFHDQIFPHIHWMEKASENSAMITAGGITGIGTYALLQNSNNKVPSELGATQIVVAGILAEYVGDMVWTKVLKRQVEAFF
jgi:hypothetical protein